MLSLSLCYRYHYVIVIIMLSLSFSMGPIIYKNVCSYCGREIEPGIKYCNFCGTKQ
ncbi:MAG: zinc-ribbon domain-containing protein [Promethearchaeia archaeon]